MRRCHRILFLLLGTTLCLSSNPQSFSQDAPERWTVFRDGTAISSAPVHLIGDVPFVDALSLCDGLNVSYFRDEVDRHVFRFPGTPVVFIPDGSFAQIGLDIIHFPIAAYRDGFRFFVPEEVFFEIIEEYLPGTLELDFGERKLEYSPFAHDLIGVEAIETGREWSWRLILARSWPGRIELTDSTHLVLRVEGAHLGGDQAELAGDSLVLASLSWGSDGERAVIETPSAIRSARLEGPDAGNVLTLHVTLASDDDEPEQPLAYGERSIIESLQEDRAKWKIDRIVIDPGHGGKDPGAIGKKNTREKDVALDIGLQLRDRLKKRLPGVETVMTRDSDEFIALGERTRIANRVNGKLFISIHCNSNRNQNARGQETYFLAPARTERAMNVALKENSVIKFEEKREDYPDLSEENFILLAMAQAQFVKESEDFATLIQSNMHRTTGLRNRGVDQAGFYVLIGASMPAVLVETAFISNPNEENLLRSRDFRGKLADGIAEAVEQFIAKYGD